MPDCLLPPDDARPAIPISAVAPGRPLTLSEEANQWLGATGFSAKAGEVGFVPDSAGGILTVLLGLGDDGSSGPARLLAGVLPSAVPPGAYRLAAGFDDAALASLGWALGAYRFTRYRARSGDIRRLILPHGVDAGEVTRIADAVYLARDLVNTPANDLGPGELSAATRRLAGRYGASFNEVVGGDALVAGGFPLIHAVGAAADTHRAPRLIDLTWGDAGHPKVTVVGKGVCFDSGGLDIKSASNMALMKKDMGGAANALGLAHMIMDGGLPVRLRVLIPAVDNAISGAAFRPGDVLPSRKGLAVEIGNTDAEGRLVLADALTLAGEEQPDLMIDLATLTGAARIALGPEVVPFYTPDDTLAADFARHAAGVADPVWRMPLWQPYASLIESKVADINNAGSSPFAGSITAALFLSRFVPEGVTWLHADIYAWNPKTAPAKPEGGEAQAIRALYALLNERYPR